RLVFFRAVAENTRLRVPRVGPGMSSHRHEWSPLALAHAVGDLRPQRGHGLQREAIRAVGGSTGSEVSRPPPTALFQQPERPTKKRGVAVAVERASLIG